MTYKNTTRKSSCTLKRRSQHNRRRNSTFDDDDDYTSVVQSDDTPNDNEPSPNEPPENDDNVNSLTDSLNDKFSLDSKITNDINLADLISESSTLPKPQPSSYVAIARFPTFLGGAGECPEAHLSRFAKVCRANDVSSVDHMVKIFPVTLLDEASLWYDLNIEPYGHQLNWEDIKSSFSSAYGSTKSPETIRAELMSIHQGQDELVRSYFLRLQRLLRKLPQHALCDDDLNQVFVQGLSIDIRDGVVPMKPGCLSEALKMAFGFERERRKTNRDGCSAAKCGFCKGLHEEKGCEVKERMRELWLRSGGKGVALAEELRRSVSSSSKSRSQCQCSKHQCWKKNLERNLSEVGGNFKG